MIKEPRLRFTEEERADPALEKPIRKAVLGMLPKNTLGRRMLLKLHVYGGAEHPHVAQKPENLDITRI